MLSTSGEGGGMLSVTHGDDPINIQNECGGMLKMETIKMVLFE